MPLAFACLAGQCLACPEFRLSGAAFAACIVAEHAAVMVHAYPRLLSYTGDSQGADYQDGRGAILAYYSSGTLRVYQAADLNPIEMVFAKTKALLRKVGIRTVDALWRAIGKISQSLTRDECANYFRHCG